MSVRRVPQRILLYVITALLVSCNTEADKQDGVNIRVRRASVIPTNLSADLTVGEPWKSNTDIHISDYIPFTLVIDVPAGDSNLVVELTSGPTDDTQPVFSICSADVYYVGSNLANASPSITYTGNTTALSYWADTVLLDFGTVSNDGSNMMSVNESQIDIEFAMFVLDSSDFIPGNTYSVYGSVSSNGGAYVWMESANFTATNQDLMSFVPPSFTLDGPSTALTGTLMNWTVTINLMDAVNLIRVDSWINGTYNMSPCKIHLDHVGEIFKCFDPKDVTYSAVNQTGSLSVNRILNAGYNMTYGNNPLDDNDVTVIIQVRIPSYVVSSDDINLNIDVYVDGKLSWFQTQTLSISPGGPTAPPSQPSFTLEKMGSILRIAKGASGVFIIGLNTPPVSVCDYVVTVTTNASLASLTDIRVISAGVDVCLDDDGPRTYTSTDGSDVTNNVNFDIGTVVNLNETGIALNSKVRIEAVVCVPLTSSVVAGDSLTLDVIISWGFGSITDSVSFLISSVNDPSEAYGTAAFPALSPTTTGFISDVVVMNVTFTLTETTDVFTLDVTAPLDTGFPLAVPLSAEFVGGGRNIGCLGNHTLPLTIIETGTDKGITFDLGLITNTGTFDRYQFGTKETSDDDVTVAIQLRIEDRQTNVHNYGIPIDTTLNGVSGTTANTIQPITVQITGSEIPALDVEIWREPFHYFERFSGDTARFFGSIAHSESSTAYAQQVNLNVMTPIYVTFASLISVNGTTMTVTSLAPEPGFKLTIPTLAFAVDVDFQFDVYIDVQQTFPMGMENVQTVVPIDLTYRDDVRGDRADPGVLHSNVTVIEFGFNTALLSVIGMENGAILDCQLSASSSQSGYTAIEARLNGTSDWKSAIRGNPFCGEEYIQVNFGNRTKVTSVSVQSSADTHTDIPDGIKLMYSEEGVVWFPVLEPDGINVKTFLVDKTLVTSPEDIFEIPLLEAEKFTGRYVRVVPVDPSCTFGLRLEFQGGAMSNDVGDACAGGAPPAAVDAQSYAINEGVLYVCSEQNVGGMVQCSVSDDYGATWTAMDDSVGKVTGGIYTANASIVVGMSTDGLTSLVSFDNGQTWDTITLTELADLQADPEFMTSLITPSYPDTRGSSVESSFSSFGLSSSSIRMTGNTPGVHVDTSGWQEVGWWGTTDWESL